MTELRLFIGKKFTGLTVEPDAKWLTMWRIHFDGRVSDMVNLTRAKDAAVGWVRPRGLGTGEVAHWHTRETALEPQTGGIPAATDTAP